MVTVCWLARLQLPVHYRDIPSLRVVSVCFGILAETAVDPAVVFRVVTNSE
jgi:hypothetical protein